MKRGRWLSIVALAAVEVQGWPAVSRPSLRPGRSSPTRGVLLETKNDEKNRETPTAAARTAVEEAVSKEQEPTDAEPSPGPVTTPPPPPPLSAREVMLALGTSPRRILLSGLSATGIALAGNLFGVTSRLLMAFSEEQVAATGLDTYYPRGDYKRIRTADYTLVIPKGWVADTAVELAKAQRRSRALDYSMQSGRKQSIGSVPDSGASSVVRVWFGFCQQFRCFGSVACPVILQSFPHTTPFC